MEFESIIQQNIVSFYAPTWKHFDHMGNTYNYIILVDKGMDHFLYHPAEFGKANEFAIDYQASSLNFTCFFFLNI